jgi:polyphosphate kinase 2 (PPK2 family)
VIDQLLVEPGTDARLRERSTGATFGLEKDHGKKQLADLNERLDVFQQRLYAESTRSLLLVLQGIDASGKDGVIRSVFKGLNPLGCRAVSFKAPTTTELAHDYLWRVHAALPARGELGIFNRSHYEDIAPFGSWASCPRPSGGDARARSRSGSGCSRTRERRS